MKKLFILMLLAACAKDITPEYFEKAKIVCKNLGGVHRLESTNNGVYAICKLQEYGKDTWIKL